MKAVCAFSGPTDFLQMQAHALKGAKLNHDSPNAPEAKLIGGPIQENKEKDGMRAADRPIRQFVPGNGPAG